MPGPRGHNGAECCDAGSPGNFWTARGQGGSLEGGRALELVAIPGREGVPPRGAGTRQRSEPSWGVGGYPRLLVIWILFLLLSIHFTSSRV